MSPDPSPEHRSRVTGVVLAAGPSTRLGGSIPKQLLELDGETLVARAARCALASRLAEVLVVTGDEATEVEAALRALPVRLVENPDFAAGQSASVRAGLTSVDPSVEAALFIPCDQPFLEPALLDRLIEAFERTGAAIVVPAHEGRRGAPVLIARRLFPELARIEGDAGGRQLFPSHEDEIVEVPVSDRRLLLDVDTPEAWERLRRSSSS